MTGKELDCRFLVSCSLIDIAEELIERIDYVFVIVWLRFEINLLEYFFYTFVFRIIGFLFFVVLY